MLHRYRLSQSLLASIGWLIVLVSDSALAGTWLQSSPIEFNRDIRPLLSEHCFACHGPDKNKREADLRLDQESGLLGSSERAGVVIAGHPERSLLIERIESTDDSLQMPPPEFGKPLTAEAKELLREWIRQGSPFEGHWAFQPIRKPGSLLTATNVNQRSTHPIDIWIDSAIDKHNLRPTPLADKVTLIRRLSLDLIGLPPSPEEVQRFLEDSSPNAYANLVERLLASEHFGERMAMWWLDLVRYADSVGYHGDQAMSISPFRDYVIQAFNSNMPFDRFTIEQLAGDLIATQKQATASDSSDPALEEQLEQLQIAAGYNRLGMMSAEGGVQDKEYLAKYIAERVRNVGGTWMGVTLGCCECHDHKYDPLTARDFYSMAAFFADIEEKGLYAGANDTGVWGPSIKVPTPSQRTQLRELAQQISEIKKTLESPNAILQAEQAQWEQTLPRWQILRPQGSTAKQGTTLTLLEDGSLLASGQVPDRESYVIPLEDLPADWHSLRLEVMTDPSLPRQGPGRAGNGNFVLTEMRLLAIDRQTGVESEVIQPWRRAVASYEQTGAADKNPYGKWKIEAAIDQDVHGAKWGWAIMEQAGAPNHAIFELKDRQSDPLLDASRYRYHLVLEQNLDNPKHTLGRFRIAIAKDVGLNAMPGVTQTLQNALSLPAEQRSEAESAQLQQYYRTIAPSLAPSRSRLAELEEARKTLDSQITSTLVTRSVEPRVVRILARGNWMDESGEAVMPNTPQCLPPMQAVSGRATRLELAQWLVSKENPLTARVLVNRLWKLLFGTGLSRRVDDFGSQGESPTHPELLDWLSNRLIDHGWDIKEMLRLLVTSETYKRQSTIAPDEQDLDPSNRWYSRQNRYRLDAELVRDQALAVSGLLVPKIGGRSVKPYQPPGYWMYLNFPQREWENGKGEELYRRGLYTHWQRQYLHPSLAAFDAPNREECTADRTRSNTPLQSLVLLNDPTYVEAARSLAQRALIESTDMTSRFSYLFQQVLSREPSPLELEPLRQVLASHHQQYVTDPIAVDRLLANGQLKVADGVDRTELAAWMSVTRVLLNLHETIVRP